MKNLVGMVFSVLRRFSSTLETLRDFDRNPMADLSWLEEGLILHPVSIRSPSRDTLVKRLLVSYRQAKAAQREVPLPYQPGGEWEGDIKARRADYLEALANSDVVSLGNLLDNFFRNGGAAGLLSYGYYPDIAKGTVLKKKWYVNRLLRDLAVWKEAVAGRADPCSLAAPFIGNPWGYRFDGHLIMPDSCRHHYYAFRAKDWLADLTRPMVAEIGGGFGGFAYHLLSQVKPCQYIGFDLPEVLLIEQYYLMSAFPERRFLLFGESEGGTISADLINRYDLILMPNFCLPKLVSDSVDLFVNTGSLSEMSRPTVQEYMAQIVRTCRAYFFEENSDQAVAKDFGHVEIPSSDFPISEEDFRKIYQSRSRWGSDQDGRYCERLFRRVNGN